MNIQTASNHLNLAYCVSLKICGFHKPWAQKRPRLKSYTKRCPKPVGKQSTPKGSCVAVSRYLEHPDTPRDEAHASIWRTSVHKHTIMAMPQAKEHRIKQWKYGSVSVKPTLLRALGLDWRRTVTTLKAHELANVSYPEVQLGGKHADGSFKTSAAKEYPSQLCKCLVAIIADDAKSKLCSGRYHVTHANELSQEERRWMDSLTAAASNVVQESWLRTTSHVYSMYTLKNIISPVNPLNPFLKPG